MEKKITFHNHREYWESDEFIRDWFGLKKEVKINNYHRSFQKKLLALPRMEKFPIVAYGSLMNEFDAERTVGTTEAFIMSIPGWERVFDIGHFEKGSFLNVRKSTKGNSMDVIIRYVNWNKMPALLLRESLYDIEEVVAIDMAGEEHLVYMVVAEDYYTNPWLLPQLNYLHLCMTGIKESGDYRMMENFLKTTYCYSDELAKEVTLEVWLENLNLSNYLQRYTYSPR